MQYAMVVRTHNNAWGCVVRLDDKPESKWFSTDDVFETEAEAEVCCQDYENNEGSRMMAYEELAAEKYNFSPAKPKITQRKKPQKTLV